MLLSDIFNLIYGIEICLLWFPENESPSLCISLYNSLELKIWQKYLHQVWLISLFHLSLTVPQIDNSAIEIII